MDRGKAKPGRTLVLRRHPDGIVVEEIEGQPVLIVEVKGTQSMVWLAVGLGVFTTLAGATLAFLLTDSPLLAGVGALVGLAPPWSMLAKLQLTLTAREADDGRLLFRIVGGRGLTFSPTPYRIIDESGELIASLDGKLLRAANGDALAKATYVPEVALPAKLVQRLGLAVSRLDTECFDLKSETGESLGQLRRNSPALDGALFLGSRVSIDARLLLAYVVGLETLTERRQSLS